MFHRNPRNFRFSLPQIVTGTAQLSAAAKNNIVLAAADSAGAGDYNQMLVVITDPGTGGPPVGQKAIITGFDGDAGAPTATIRCLDTLDGLWTNRVQADSKYAICTVLRDQPFRGTVQASGSNGARALVLASGESNKDGFYAGLAVEIVAGAGAHEGQLHPIVKYTGASRLCEVEGAFDATPDNTSVYKIRGHLYPNVTRMIASEASASSILVSSSPAGVALGAYGSGTEIDETWLAGQNYLEIVATVNPAFLEMTRWE